MILRQTSVTRLHADTVCPWDECPAFEKRAGGEPENNSPCLSNAQGHGLTRSEAEGQ
jgi:hypothetical protein